MGDGGYRVHCTGKTPYANAVLAWRVVKRRLRQHWKRDRPLTAYRCVDCGRWHIGGLSDHNIVKAGDFPGKPPRKRKR